MAGISISTTTASDAESSPETKLTSPTSLAGVRLERAASNEQKEISVAKEFSHIDESIREFIGNQAMFFVATAPSDGGRVNLSPKGYRDTFAVLDDHTVV